MFKLLFMENMSRLFVVFVLFTFHSALFAQKTFSIRGKITDNVSGEVLDAANVVVIKAKDSVFVAGSISDEKGNFEIVKINAGAYQLVISYLGYQTVIKPFTLSGDNLTVDIGQIVMQKQNLELEEVVVAAKFNPIIVKKDTVEFNTSAYKLQESAVVEDLLKKLPGVEVDQDGTVTAGGEQITKVYVDGKQFFGDDPKIATKNLPANIVDKVQVVDRKSDQAQFTGIEDDNTEKVINLTLRPGNRNGLFGRAIAGYGNDDRYDGNGIINYFEGETQLAVLFSANNTNNIGFSDFMGDMMNNMGGGGRRQGGSRGGGGGSGGRGGNYNLGGMSIGQNNGISSNMSGGTNINYRFGEKVKLGANYFFNTVDRKTDQSSHRENILPDSIFYYDQLQNQNRKSQNHRVNFELDYKINENSSLLFRPNLSLGSGDADSDYKYETFTPAGILLNNGNTLSGSSNNSISSSGTLLLRHKFNKAGRTFSMNLSYGYTDNDADGTNLQYNSVYNVNNTFKRDTLDQHYTNNNNSYNYGIRASYTEPVGNNRFLEFSYSYNRSNTKSEKRTYDFNPADSGYNLLDSAYSSKYENIYVNQQADVRFNTRRDKYSYTLGVGVQPSSLTSITWPDDKRLKQNVVNLSPSANFTYGISRQNMLRIDYRGNTIQPTIQQLQPVADNSDPLYEREGNPSLKPAFRHTARISYNNFNPVNLRTFLTSLSFNTTNNSIINSSVYDETGKQTVKPVNVNGIYNINASVMVNMPVPETKLSLSNTLSGNFNNNVNYLNGQENTTKNTGINETLRLTYRNDRIELAGSYRLGYNNARYSIESKSTTNYYNHRASGELLLNLPWKLILSSTVNYNFYSGYEDNVDRNMALWNADLSRLVFKNKSGTIKLSIYDILKENKSFNRVTTDNYIEDVHTNTIGQFIMVSFMWRFNSFSSGTTNDRSGRPREGFQRQPEGQRPPRGDF